MFIYVKHLSILRTSLQSQSIRRSDMQGTFKDTQRAIEHSRYSKSTWALGSLEGTWALGYLKDISEDTRRAVRHLKGTRSLGLLRHSSARTLMVLRHLGSWALKGTQVLSHLGHLGTWVQGHLDTWGILFSRLDIPTENDWRERTEGFLRMLVTTTRRFHFVCMKVEVCLIWAHLIYFRWKLELSFY